MRSCCGPWTYYVNTFETLLSQYGYWALFGSILLEDFGLPVPGEALLIAGSVMAAQGSMHIVPLLLLAWAGAVLGDNIGFGIGRFGGRRLVLRYGPYVFITASRLNDAERFFRKHGGVVVVAARFIEILRQLNGIIAGMVQMEWKRFLSYNILGAALWVGFWGILAYEIGSGVSGFLLLFDRFEIYVFVVLGLGAALLVAYLIIHRGRGSSKDG